MHAMVTNVLFYNSFVLNFAYAEALEVQNQFTEVHATFERFLETLRKDLEALETKLNAASSSSNSLSSHQSQQGLVAATEATSSKPQNGMHSQNSSFNTQSTDDKPLKNKELSDKRTHYGIAWVVYIRFARRAEGLKSARSVFGKARRDRWTPWEVHEAEGTTCSHYLPSTNSTLSSTHGISLREHGRCCR